MSGSSRLPFLVTLLIVSMLLLIQSKAHAETLVLSPENGAPKSKHPVTSPAPVKHKQKPLQRSKKPLPVMDSDHANSK